MDEIVVYILYGVAATGLSFLVVLAIRLCIAPYRIQQDIQDTCDGLQEENAELKRGKPRLELEYTRSKIIEHPNGFVEVRILLWNRGSIRAERVRVVLASLEHMEDRDTSYAGQFTCRLHVIGKKLGFDLQAGEAALVRVIKAEKGAEWFLIDGYTDDPNDPQECTFRTKSKKSRLTITASALEGIPDERTFIVSQDVDGLLDVKASPRKSS